MVLLALTMMLPAQTEKTVLFLVPFYSNQYETQNLSSIQEDADMYQVNAFQLMGFWAGAQIALDEYAAQGTLLKIIVKDISDSEAKLRSVLENQSLMNEVDLIVGPFFSKQFAIASKYAKDYKIPIVNPFTTRTDILENNEYVYKLLPSLESRPATISFMADMYPNHQILIYADSTKKTKEFLAYTSYFKSKNISYKIVPFSGNLVNNLKSGAHNIIVVLSEDEARAHMISRDLVYKADLNNITFVVPEAWLDMPTYDVEYYAKLNIHFFSDYFVDKSTEQTKLFVHKYTEKFNTPPMVKTFGFQGYDATKFFVELVLNDMDIDRVKFVPMSYRFSFDKVNNGGYENVNVQFLEVKENIVQPVGF